MRNMIALSAAAVVELYWSADAVSKMPGTDEDDFTEIDLAGAAIDFLGGSARAEVDEAVASHGWDAVAAYVAQTLR